MTEQVDVKSVTSRLIEEEGFDPKKAESVAKEYKNVVEVQGFDTGETAMAIAKQAIEDQYKEGDRPTEDFQDFNSDASLHAERHARRGVDDYRDELNASNEDFVETAKKKIVNIEETVEETNWDEVERELKMRLENRLHQEDVRASIRNAIYEHANYDYTESEVNQFANDIVEMVAKDEADRIANELVREMETGDIEAEEENIQRSMKEMFTREAISGASEGVAKKMYTTVSTAGLKAIGSVIGSAIATGVVLI